MNSQLVIQKRDEVLGVLADKLDGFYLAGGTALSLFYFQHRESYDLDFFTREFSRDSIERIVEYLRTHGSYSIDLIGEKLQSGCARMLVYALKVDENNVLKIDFVEDVHKLIGSPGKINQVPILSLPDIYYRKILTACGSIERVDSTGRSVFVGGRQESKDFFDLYFLSTTFMPLSKFAGQYLSPAQKESIVIWYHTYDRLDIKSGLTEIITNKKISFPDMERHYKAEVDTLVGDQT